MKARARRIRRPSKATDEDWQMLTQAVVSKLVADILQETVYGSGRDELVRTVQKRLNEAQRKRDEKRMKAIGLSGHGE